LSIACLRLFTNSIKRNWSETKSWSVTARPAPLGRVIFCLSESIQIDSGQIKASESNMHTESVEIIEVECATDSDESEPIRESIHDFGESIRSVGEPIYWLTASESRHRTRLEKTPFQRAMTELVHEHQIPISYLRRGEARNTQYSSIAIDLIKALKARDTERFEGLKKDLIPPVTPTPVSGDYAIALTCRADNFLQKTSIEAESLEAQILQTLAKISQQQKTMQQANATLSEAEKIAARNEGISAGLEVVAIRQAAKNEVIARAQSMGLAG
jgi:vacuolar-type H+-ATPase subunit I/STV1